MSTKKNRTWRRNSKAYMVRELVEGMLRQKRLILEMSEHMAIGNRCPLDWQLDRDHGHREITKFIAGQNSMDWVCPFCGHVFKAIRRVAE